MDGYGCGGYTLILLFAMAMPLLTRCASSKESPACSSYGVIPVTRPPNSKNNQYLFPSLACASSKRIAQACALTFRVEDEFMRLITQLCAEGYFYIACQQDSYHASIRVFSDRESFEISCLTKGNRKLCAPRGEDLKVQYRGNIFCPHETVQKLDSYLNIYQKTVYKNIMKLTRSHNCGHSLFRAKANGTIISVYKPDNKGGLVLCPVTVELGPGEKRLCLKFEHFDTYSSDASLNIKSRSKDITLIEKPWETVKCVYLPKKDTEVTFSVIPGRRRERGRHHLILFEYLTIYKNRDTGDDEEDDDDDNDDLYWLFVIPGVAIISCCCYCCCKEDKDETQSGESAAQPVGGLGAQTPLQSEGIANNQGSGDGGDASGGDGSAEMTSAFIQPSAPPADEPPPFTMGMGSGGGDLPGAPPPSYFALFPDQKPS